VAESRYKPQLAGDALRPRGHVWLCETSASSRSPAHPDFHVRVRSANSHAEEKKKTLVTPKSGKSLLSMKRIAQQKEQHIVNANSCSCDGSSERICLLLWRKRDPSLVRFALRGGMEGSEAESLRRVVSGRQLGCAHLERQPSSACVLPLLRYSTYWPAESLSRPKINGCHPCSAAEDASGPLHCGSRPRKRHNHISIESATSQRR
jgi:hypothetical protein